MHPAEVGALRQQCMSTAASLPALLASCHHKRPIRVGRPWRSTGTQSRRFDAGGARDQ